MKVLAVGDLVRLIATDGYMPPLGQIGIVETTEDATGDHDVLFPAYPCPVPPGTFWVAHKSWLHRIPPLAELESQQDQRFVPVPKTHAHKEYAHVLK